MREELLSPDLDPVDIEVEVGLRPRRLDDFVGQTELKGHLRVMLAAAAGSAEGSATAARPSVSNTKPSFSWQYRLKIKWLW